MMGDIADNRQAVERVVQDRAAWVFAAARRRVKDAALAEDVTQAVFLLYWRKRPGGERPGKVAGWLYRAVRYCSANALRLKQIQQRHEREAAMQKKERIEGTGADWTEVEAELEGAMDRLSERDRQAVLLRFYEQRPLAEVGKALGISEEAARMRVQRAVEKLRGMLGKKGISGTTAGLSAVLVGNVVGQMPVGLVEKVMAGIGGGGGNGTAGLIAKGAEKMMVWAKVKVAAVVVMMMFGMLGVGLWAGAAGSGTQPTSRLVKPAGTVSATMPAAGKIQAPTIDELLARLEESRKAVVRVHVRGGYRLQVMEQGADQWRETPSMADSEAWIELQPILRFRCDKSLEVSEWSQGTAPYTAESSRSTWDGRQGLYRRTGSAHHDGVTLRALEPLKEDHPLDGKDTQSLWLMAGQFAVGLPFAGQLAPAEVDTKGCLDQVRMLASGDPQLAGKMSCKIDTVAMAEEERVHLQITALQREQHDYWFSPAHGWMCCRYEYRRLANTGKLVKEWEVEEFVGSGNAWYPARASHVWWEMPDPSGGGKVRAERRIYKTDVVEVNPKAFDEATFGQ